MKKMRMSPIPTDPPYDLTGKPMHWEDVGREIRKDATFRRSSKAYRDVRNQRQI